MGLERLVKFPAKMLRRGRSEDEPAVMSRLELHLHIPPSTLPPFSRSHSLSHHIASLSQRVESLHIVRSTYDTTELPSMPAHSDDGSSQADPNAVSVACPRPLSPTLPSDGECKADGVLVHPAPDAAAMSPPASDNTAVGMSLQQEDSMYSTPDAPRDTNTAESEKDKPDVVMSEERNDVAPTKQAEHEISSPREDTQAPESPASLDLSSRTSAISQLARADRTTNTQLQTPSPTLSNASLASVVKARRSSQNCGVPTIDRELHHISESKPWEFSRGNVKSQYPSALFQTGSKYIGSQQSDRQIYNVEVTILTVDMEQCTTSGYLQICGLTPDHPTLTTFFTGEIIGGPDQKFGFRTKSSEWGATDKTDMTHWARFPAWRSLSSQAKQDLSFVHPSDQSPWWQQESIFMRWKEHFLVPDYKLRSIQGASFEGFYYICLNQIEAKISGIYFHSKSEK